MICFHGKPSFPLILFFFDSCCYFPAVFTWLRFFSAPAFPHGWHGSVCMFARSSVFNRFYSFIIMVIIIFYIPSLVLYWLWFVLFQLSRWLGLSMGSDRSPPLCSLPCPVTWVPSMCFPFFYFRMPVLRTLTLIMTHSRSRSDCFVWLVTYFWKSSLLFFLFLMLFVCPFLMNWINHHSVINAMMKRELIISLGMYIGHIEWQANPLVDEEIKQKDKNRKYAQTKLPSHHAFALFLSLHLQHPPFQY